MISALLVGAFQARMSTPVIVALLVVAAASALSLYVSILIARRLRSIGDAGETKEAPVEPVQDVPSTSTRDA